MLRTESYVRFPGFVLDAADARLLGAHGPVHVGRKAFQVLEALVAQPGRLLTKEDLLETVWGGVLVSESSLTTVIKELRRALGDESKQPRFIQSVYGRGYRFIAPVSATPHPVPAGALLAGDPPREDVVAARPPSVTVNPPRSAPSRRLALGLGAAGVAVAIGSTIGLRRAAPPPVSPEIEAIIAQARHLMGQNTLEGQNQSIGLYRRVVELRPDFADGWGLLGLAYSIVSHFRPQADGLVLRARAKAAATRAIELDTGNGLGESALGLELPFIGHWLERDRRFDRAVQDRPGHVDILTFIALILQSNGRASEAVTVYDRIAERPLCPITSSMFIHALWTSGRMEEADRAMADAAALYPSHADIWLDRFRINMFGGRIDEALALLGNPTGRPPQFDDRILADLKAQATAFPSPGSPQAELTLAAIVRGAPLSAGAARDAIRFAGAMGALDTAFRLADAYYFSRGFAIPDFAGPDAAISLDQRQTLILFEPPAAAMRADPRFEPLVAEIGLDAYWRASGRTPDYRRERPNSE